MPKVSGREVGMPRRERCEVLLASRLRGYAQRGAAEMCNRAAICNHRAFAALAQSNEVINVVVIAAIARVDWPHRVPGIATNRIYIDRHATGREGPPLKRGR